ncbi:hypothetical protein [Halalkalibacter oceani]|uniref:hypothetical protein n=1 Tax=Halalkalibacter oceani TaxID=1653776 RepID=UPI0033936970
MRELTIDVHHVGVRYTIDNLNGTYTRLDYVGFADIVNQTVFYVMEGKLYMSGYHFDHVDDWYDVTDFSRISLMNVEDPESFDYDEFLAFYERMNRVSLYQYLLLFFDRKQDVDLRLERLR